MADYDAPLVELIRHMKYERVRRAEPETTLINMDFATEMWATFALSASPGWVEFVKLIA